MTAQLATILDAVRDEPRLLIEASLRPVQGDRFQPTGFPDLGAALYRRPDGTEMLLIESAQSMANRMELVCWDQAGNRIVEPLAGLPHVVVDLGNRQQTSSIQEAHRLNSPYIVNSDKVKNTISSEVGNAETGVLDIRRLAHSVFKLDPCSVLHGVFLEKIAGRLRLQRLLSSFIEAENAQAATSGGVKLDRVNPSGDAAQGFGNVPFTRTEFTAEKITAYFNLDLATMRGYGLGEAANRLLVALSLYKITSLLLGGLRLRTACDLEAEAVEVTRPKNLVLGDLNALRDEMAKALPGFIRACEFGDDPVTRLEATIAPKKAKGKAKDATGNAAPQEPSAGEEGEGEQ
jgi:CRISPR-associated protein Csb1